MNKQTTTTRLLRMPAVQEMTQLSKTEIYRRMDAGTFPKPIKLGRRAIAWPAAEIEAWINDLVKGASK